ncbi:MAG TPA: hypothetical protein DG355_04145, partial [Candidatus Cloacimonas sp.]|nr:hypothetical protein [Candidatus Cloacimonas sp.]
MGSTESDKLNRSQLTLWDFRHEDTAERECSAGVWASPRMEETETTNKAEQEGRLLEQILSSENMERAIKRVKSNKGAKGVDGMTVDDLDRWLAEQEDALRQSLLDGKYRPQPVRRVDIPKDKGKTRPLGIPTVV